uniref:Uncharacterized protein n=1 Tax=Micrurus corallinus TaxID=54390 RepID=A0A2D4GWF1_MICCO
MRTSALRYQFTGSFSQTLYSPPQKVNSDSRRKQNTALNLGRKEFKKKSPVPPTLAWRTDFLHMRYFAFYSLSSFFPFKAISNRITESEEVLPPCQSSPISSPQ